MSVRRTLDDIWDGYMDGFATLARVMTRVSEIILNPLNSAMRRVPGMQRFDDWANGVERRHRARKYAPLIVQLHSAGMHEQADQLAAVWNPR